jgi:transcriptional regulator with XRE-family HTH domain
MKEANGLSNLEVAERSGVSIKTIERIMAQNCDHDILRETARLVEDAIIGSSNQYPCYLAFEENVPEINEKLNDAMRDLERALADNADYRKALDNIHDSYKAELQLIRDEAQAKIAEMRSHIDRLQRDNDYLWVENNRKSKLVDMLLEKK